MYNRNSLKLCTFYRSLSLLAVVFFLVFFLLFSLFLLAAIPHIWWITTRNCFIILSKFQKKVFSLCTGKMDNFYHFSAPSFLLHFTSPYTSLFSDLFLVHTWVVVCYVSGTWRKENEEKCQAKKIHKNYVYTIILICDKQSAGGRREERERKEQQQSEDDSSDCWWQWNKTKTINKWVNHNTRDIYTRKTKYHKLLQLSHLLFSSRLASKCQSCFSELLQIDKFHPLIMWNNVLCSANDLRDYEMHHRQQAIQVIDCFHSLMTFD